MPALEALGWDAATASAFEQLQDDNLFPARVAAQHRGEYVLFSADGDGAAASGSVRVVGRRRVSARAGRELDHRLQPQREAGAHAARRSGGGPRGRRRIHARESRRCVRAGRERPQRSLVLPPAPSRRDRSATRLRRCRTLRPHRLVTRRPVDPAQLGERRPVALHPLRGSAEGCSRLGDLRCIRPCGRSGRLVLSVSACYGQFVPGDKGGRTDDDRACLLPKSLRLFV